MKDKDSSLYYCQSRYYDPAIGRFLNADAFASTGQGLLGNNMFAYCLNNPTKYSDATGRASRISFGDNFDILAMPWMDSSSGGAGGIYVICSGQNSYSVMEETTQPTNKTKTVRLLSVEFGGIGVVGKNDYSIISVDASVVSLDLATEHADLSLFDLGNASAAVGVKHCIPYVDMMVSAWSPSIEFNLGTSTVCLALHFGAYGVSLCPDPSNFKIGYAKGVGFSLSIT